MPKKTAIHPGLALKQYLEPFNLSVTELAGKLGVSKSSLSRLLAGKSDMTADMAVRLGLAILGNPQGWMDLQTAYSIEQARKRIDQATVSPIL